MSNLPGFYNNKGLLVFIGILLLIFFSIYVFEVVKLFIIAFVIVYITSPIKLYFDKYDNDISSFFIARNAVGAVNNVLIECSTKSKIDINIDSVAINDLNNITFILVHYIAPNICVYLIKLLELTVCDKVTLK